jgi:hypothetical protein
LKDFSCSDPAALDLNNRACATVPISDRYLFETLVAYSRIEN